MNRPTPFVVGTWVLLCCPPVLGTSWDTVIFSEDFSASVGGRPDPADWIINHPGVWWWLQGRTHFPNPDPWLATGEFPRVADGACRIEHHLYNVYDLADVNVAFLGGELRTKQVFDATRAYRFEATVHYSVAAPYVSYPDGLVTSFFVYGYDGVNADEIDFEFLSNRTNDDATYAGGDPVLTNTWNESVQNPQHVETVGLDLTVPSTFRIYWDPVERRIDWTWLDPVNGETWLRTETGNSVPDQPMALYFNFWAPDSTWPDAYAASLQPVSKAIDDEASAYQIDFVEVRVRSAPVPTVAECGLGVLPPLLLSAGAILLIRRRSSPHTAVGR